MDGKASRLKGANGEREFRNLLRKHGFKAERTGRSERNTKDDLAHNVPGIHFEVKRRNGFDPVAWIRQARRDANGRVPVAAWRRNQGEWLVILGAEEFLNLVKSKDDDTSPTDTERLDSTS